MILARCLLLLLLALSAMTPAGELEQKQARLQQLQERIRQLQGDLGESRQRRQKLEQELANSERAIGESSRELYRVERELAAGEKNLQQLQQRRRQQEQLLGRQEQALRGQVRAAYMMGRQQRLKILLNQQDPSVVSRVMVYYDYFHRARLQRMQEIGQLLEQLSRTSEQISLQQKGLQRDRAAKKQHRDQLGQGQELRRQVLQELERQIQDQGSEISSLNRDAGQLQALLGRLQQQLQDIPNDVGDDQPFNKRRGRLAWPTSGSLKVRFGSSKVGSLKWDGVIISAPEGQEVRAVHHGRVAFADWLRGFGLLLIIDHGDGYMTLYGYNQSLFKETGEWVEAGEPVARVGSSGGQRNSGLYFGIRYKGRPVNPQQWARRLKGNRVGALPAQGQSGPRDRPIAEADNT